MRTYTPGRPRRPVGPVAVLAAGFLGASGATSACEGSATHGPTPRPPNTSPFTDSGGAPGLAEAGSGPTATTHFILGANAPWYNGYRGLDLAPYLGKKTIASVSMVKADSGLKNADPTAPPIVTGATGYDASGIDATLEDMRSIGIKAVRWYFGVDGRALFSLDAQDDSSPIDTRAYPQIDHLLAAAEVNGISVIPVLFDFRLVNGDEHLLYRDGTPGTPHPRVVADPQKRAALLQNYVEPLVSRYASSHAILAWEIMVEAANSVIGTDAAGTKYSGNHCSDGSADPSGTTCHVSPTQMQAFFTDVYRAIKSVDTAHPVLPSGLARPRELTLVVGAVPADLYGAHYDDSGSECGMIQSVAEVETTYLTPHDLKLDKPLLMTEGTSGPNTACYASAAFSGGWAGYLAWGYYGLVGLSDFSRYTGIVTSADGSKSHQEGMAFYQQFSSMHAADVAPTLP
jgi:hypothetical protein